MTDLTDIEETAAPKSSRLLLIVGLILALAGGGGGFYAVYSGMILGAHSGAEDSLSHEDPVMALPDTVFIPIDPIVISLTGNSTSSHLRFRAQLEVPRAEAKDVERILPRIVDVLNSYLRALEPADIEAAGALIKLRAQMLRRVQIVTGKGRVRDLLVMEFVLN
ncbi:flagellar basal body-associated FliL family protein [Shimia sp.]|uniref:flagellar basal body-associated FliL family protein n=1 Tax=Shimia sp. TaxID=1954381 RepID=UPI0032972792